MIPLESSDRSPASPLRCTAFGLLLGATIGLIEVTTRFLQGNADPSTARRAARLLVYAATWYGALGGAGFLVAGIVAKFGEARRWRTSSEGPLPVVVGTLTTLLLPLLAIDRMGARLAEHSRTIRLALFVLIGLVAVVSGWIVARRLSARPGGLLAAASRKLWHPRVATLVLVLASVGAVLFALKDRSGALEPRPGTEAPTPPADAPNVIVVLVDTLRADALGCYGSSEPTPAFDALAAKGALFEHAIAPASWTLPSVGSFLTSSPPWMHGATDFIGVGLSRDVTTLPEELSSHGYECLASVGNPFVNADMGFDRGFHVYDVYSQPVETKLAASRLFDRILHVTGLLRDPRFSAPWIDPDGPYLLTTKLNAYVLDEDVNERAFRYAWPTGDRPAFLYLQYVAPHTPYLEHPLRVLKSQPPLVQGNLDLLRARYAREVAYTDAMLAELLEALERDDLLANSYVVITSDHGEEFLEHGDWEHGKNGLYQEVVHVPLIVMGPGITPGLRISERVQLLDVAPTLLDLAGLPVPQSFQGRSLAPRLRGEVPSLSDLTAFLEVDSRALIGETRYFAALRGRFKIVRQLGLDGKELRQEIYDLRVDPDEKKPLRKVPDELAPLLESLAEYEQYDRSRSEAPADAEGPDAEALQALGYADSGDEGQEDSR